MAESTITPHLNTEILVDSTPTLIASGRTVFGLNDTIPVENYESKFYYNILPFKVKNIVSVGGSGEFICCWTIDNRLLFSGYIYERNDDNYFIKYHIPKEKEYINDKLSELFEFKWKDFVNNKVNLQSTRPFQTINNINIKKVYALDGDCIIIELDNNIL
ncbi:hypothetical protein ABK040_000556 [Willaertia magna]